MKKIDTNKSREELTAMIKEQKVKLFKFRFDLNENRLKDVSQIKKAKKDIARILTVLNKKHE